jgi:hypothetical protein
MSAGRPQRLRSDEEVLAGWLARATGDTAAAHAHFVEALRFAGYFDGKRVIPLRPTLVLAAETALSMGRPDSALTFARDARTLSTFDSLTESRSAYVGEARLVEARALLASGDTSAARTSLERAALALRNGAGADHPRTREAETMLAALRR